MTTTYYVVPADRHFATTFPQFANRKMAEDEIAAWAALGDDGDFGIYEVKLVAGVGKADWPGDQIHVRGGRNFIVSSRGNGFTAYCDNLGADDSPTGDGGSPAEAVEDCIDGIERQEARVAAKRAARAARVEEAA